MHCSVLADICTEWEENNVQQMEWIYENEMAADLPKSLSFMTVFAPICGWFCGKNAVAQSDMFILT